MKTSHKETWQLWGQIYTFLTGNFTVEPIIRDLVFFSPQTIHAIIAQNFPTRNSSQSLPKIYYKDELKIYITMIQLSLESPINKAFLQSIAEENIYMVTHNFNNSCIDCVRVLIFRK